MFPGFCGNSSLLVKISFAHETSPVWASQIVFPAVSSLFWNPFLQPSHLSHWLRKLHKALSVSLWDTNTLIREYCASQISPPRLLLIMRVNNASVWSTYILYVQYCWSFLLCLPKQPSIGRSMAGVIALKYWRPLLAIYLPIHLVSQKTKHQFSRVSVYTQTKKKNLLHPSANQTSCSFLERQQTRCCCFQIQKQNKVTNRKSTTKTPTGTVSDPTQFRSDASHSQYQGFASLRDHIDKGMWAGSFVWFNLVWIDIFPSPNTN